MPIAAGISAAGSVISGGLGAWAANSAADKQAQAAQSALALQQDIYNKNSNNLNPYIQFGNNATASLADLYGLSGKGGQGTKDAFDAFTNLPAFQFPYQQGLRALNFNLNAQGKQQSGAMAKETQQFGQGLASQYLMSNYVNPLTNFAGLGKDAAANLAGTSTTAAGQMGATTQGIGTAQASGLVGAANAFGGGINNAAGSLGLYSLIAKQGGGVSAYGGNNPTPPAYAYGAPAGYGPTGNAFGNIA